MESNVHILADLPKKNRLFRRGRTQAPTAQACGRLCGLKMEERGRGRTQAPTAQACGRLCGLKNKIHLIDFLTSDMFVSYTNCI